jgi:hypothetical protein
MEPAESYFVNVVVMADGVFYYLKILAGSI